MRTLLGILLLLAATAASPAARTENDHTERIAVPLSDPARPATVKVSSITGGITVTGYGGHEVLIEASGHDQPGRREEEAGSQPPAGAAGMHHIADHTRGLSVEEENNVVHVQARPSRQATELRLQVPSGSSLNLSCVNGGDIRVTGVEGEMELGNVNGAIAALDVAGVVVAHTTNGSVRIVMSRITPDKPMAFSSLNGDIDVTFPPDLRANVRLSSINGELRSDFAIVRDGSDTAAAEPPGRGRRVPGRQEMHGRINGGGVEMLFKTFNGNVLLHRAKS
jgi:hypothetical protein